MTEGIESGSDDTTSKSLVGKVSWLQYKILQLMEKDLDADLKREIGTNFSLNDGRKCNHQREERVCGYLEATQGEV